MTNHITKLTQLLEPLAPIHFIGIGGSGMSPLAMLVKAAGVSISGSDINVLPPEMAEIAMTQGHSDCGLALAATSIVVSSAISGDNPELMAAKSAGKKLLHRSELLDLVSRCFKTITVAGTHGKSTTSALISHLLIELGLDPSFVLGAKLIQSSNQSSAWRLGQGGFLVLEADESDGSFQRYHPHIAVVTNIDPDHMDYFESMASMENAFHVHLQNVVEDGVAIMFWDHERVRTLAQRDFSARRLTYGSLLGSEVRLLAFKQHGPNLEFSAVVEHEVARFELPLIGRHNAMNALAALSVAHFLGFSAKDCLAALASFPGVSRRLALHYAAERLVIYDDYAHNPVKISSCLEGLRAAFPRSHLVAVFQAHRYSRLRHLYQELLSSFAAVDQVIVTPVYGAGEAQTVPANPETLATDITKLSRVPASGCQSLKEATKLLQLSEISKHTVIVTIGAGDVWTVARDLGKHFAECKL